MDAPLTSPDIRPLGAADAEAWRALRLQALKEEPRAFTASYEEAAATAPADFARRMPSDGGPAVLFGLFVEGALEGSAGFSVQQGRKLGHKGLLWGVYIRPDWRRRGFGRALVGRVISHARAHVALLQAAVVADNISARRLYRSLGFEPYGVERAAVRVDGEDVDEVLLWIDFRPKADLPAAALPAAALSDRRAP
jgi:ribosomal protein S18 acetylase RimI-like enzyme